MATDNMISLNIDGRWEPGDFADVLTGIESIYYKVVLDPWEIRRLRPSIRPRAEDFWYRELDSTNRALLDRARTVAPPEVRLRVSRIEFASPGGIDLAGLGQATDAIDRLIGRLIGFFTDRELRRQRDKQAALDTEIKEQNLIALKIQNARELLELRRTYPEIDETLVALLVRDQDKLTDRISQGLITGSRTQSEIDD